MGERLKSRLRKRTGVDGAERMRCATAARGGVLGLVVILLAGSPRRSAGLREGRDAAIVLNVARACVVGGKRVDDCSIEHVFSIFGEGTARRR